METTRGCATQCAFCQYPKMGRSMRYFGLERVLLELDHIRRLGIETVYFGDGIFTLRVNRAREIFGTRQDGPGVAHENGPGW